MSKAKDQRIKDLQEENSSLKQEVIELKSLLMLAEFAIELATSELQNLSKNQINNEESSFRDSYRISL